MTEPRYTIYGKEQCSYCVAAKQALDARDLPYDYHDVMVDLDRRTEMINRVPVPVRTVPQILLGDEYIGGYTELVMTFSEPVAPLTD